MTDFETNLHYFGHIALPFGILFSRGDCITRYHRTGPTEKSAYGVLLRTVKMCRHTVGITSDLLRTYMDPVDPYLMDTWMHLQWSDTMSIQLQGGIGDLGYGRIYTFKME